VLVVIMVLLLGWDMLQDSSTFLGFTNGAIHHTQNLAYTTWVMYSPIGQLVASGGSFLDPSTNNVDKYSVFIKLLHYSIVKQIHSL
jgi:hypothetical protein